MPVISCEISNSLLISANFCVLQKKRFFCRLCHWRFRQNRPRRPCVARQSNAPMISDVGAMISFMAAICPRTYDVCNLSWLVNIALHACGCVHRFKMIYNNPVSYGKNNPAAAVLEIRLKFESVTRIVSLANSSV